MSYRYSIYLRKTKVKKAKYCLRLLEKTWYVALSKRQYFYVFNDVNHLRKKSGKCMTIFSYCELKQLVQMLQCLWCCEFWTKCILMIFIIRNDLWILVFITIKIIRNNVFHPCFNSFFPSFLSQPSWCFFGQGMWFRRIQFSCGILVLWYPLLGCPL